MSRHTNYFLEEYADKVFSGEIIAGREMKQGLERLIAGLTDPRYIYDTTEADRRIDFMEHCVRLTKAPFYGQPMVLMLWQKAWLSALYGFKMDSDGTDRFRRTLLLLARKNGKSELCSGLILTDLIIGPPGADIVCSSNDDKQANILYEATDTMRLMIDPRQQDTWKNQQHIRNLATNAKVFKISDKTKNKEGRNIDEAVVDEIHEMKDNTVVKSIEQSQSLKPNPKLILITTEGFVNGGFLDEELEKKARPILRGEDDSISAERYLPWLYTQDSEQEVWQNEESWLKSNPSLGTIKRWDYMYEQIDGAKKSKADRMFVLSKDFNLKVTDSQAWLQSEYVENSGDYSLDSFRNTIALGAADLAETTDMCSAKIIMLREDDPQKYIYQMYWIPESKLERSDDREAGARYQEWAQEGLLRIVPGNDIDVALVADWFYELYRDNDIKTYKIGYDQRFAKEFIKRLDEYGFEHEIIYQNRYILSTPMRLVEADLRDHLIAFNDNPIDKWCLLNTSMQMYNTGHVMPVKIKGQAARRIDGAATMIMAYEMLRRYRTEIQNAIMKG